MKYNDDVAILEKLFQVPGLTPNSFSHREIAMLYEYWSQRTCDRLNTLGKECGGRTVIRSLKPSPGSSIYNRLFIGCEKYTPRSRHHTFQSVAAYDPVTILQIWGRERCYGIHQDFKDLMQDKWYETAIGTISPLVYD